MRDFFPLFLVLMSAFLMNGCKLRSTKSNVTGISTRESGLLDLAQVRDPEALKQLCQTDDLVVFIGNGEKFGVVMPNMDVESSRRLSEEDLSDLNRYDAQKDRWYFSKIKEEYAALSAKMAQENPACAKLPNIQPKVQVLAILDGPEIGDSQIEITTFGRQEKGTWQILEKPTALQFDRATSTLSKVLTENRQELLMPRDVPAVIDTLTKGRKKPFRFALTILKGHGLKMHMREDGDVSLLNVFYFRTAGIINQYEDISVTLLDTQDASGALPFSKSPIFAPIWSPNAICYLISAGPQRNACIEERKAFARRGFKPSTILGCGHSKLAEISDKQGDEKQGDEKQGDEKQGDEKQGDEKQGDEKQGKQGDEKQGDEKQGDEKQGIFLQGLGGFNTAGDELQGAKGIALFQGKQTAFAQKMQKMFPAAVRYLGSGSVLARLGETTADGNLLPMYNFRLPVEALTHLVLIDSCSMELDQVKLNQWFGGRGLPAQVDGTILVNPFPLSADAIQYGALNLPQYYYLLTSIFTDVYDRARPSGPLSQLTHRLNDVEDKSRRDKLLAALGPFKKGNEKVDDVYCSMYPAPFSCSGGMCTFVDDPGKTFGNICPSKLWQDFDPGCSPPTRMVELKILQHTVTTLEGIDTALKILRNHQPIPHDLYGRIWAALEVEIEGLYGQGHPRDRHFGAMRGEYRFYKLNPVMEQGDFAAPEELLLQERYLEMLKRYLNITHLGRKYPFDPLKFAIVGVGKMHLNKMRNSRMIEPTKAIFADLVNNFELGSAEQLTAREQFMEFLQGDRPVLNGQQLLRGIIEKERVFVEEMGRQKTFVKGSYEGWTPPPHLVEIYRDLLREILRVTE
ncbi:MAG: hypothetical protein NTV34_05660 [Proteobacteria bacterium]|nr:hypothetical protein [Pseudomonadota bacterium]